MMLFKELCKMNKDYLIFITALSFYLFLAIAVNQKFIGSDGRSFQRMAVNIAEGNGFSSKIDPPYEPQFFREPGFPFLFSLACRINSALGNENIHLPYEVLEFGYHDTSHTEIVILRTIQSLLAALSVLLFFKITLTFLKPKVALTVALLFIFYLPFSIFVTYPQREMLVAFLLMAMAYLFILSAKSQKSLLYDILFGITAAFLVLTLQAYVFILPVFLLSHWMITKSFAKTLKSAFVIAIVFLIGVAPWTYRGYKEANDWRVVKTFGVSYTYEFKKFHDANFKAYYMNLDNNAEEFRQRVINGYHEPGKIMFEKSFNGYYTSYADSLMKVIEENRNESVGDMLKRTVTDLISVNFRKALIWPLWKPDYRKNISELLSGEHRMQMILSMTAGILVFLISITGMIKYIPKLWYFLPVFIFHALMIPLMATEGRRVMPYLPFYFMFFILGINNLHSKYLEIFSGKQSSNLKDWYPFRNE
jgi:4-amino-4-deoxy-L-arabinose transferase-like glycosyltransferase